MPIVLAEASPNSVCFKACPVAGRLAPVELADVGKLGGVGIMMMRHSADRLSILLTGQNCKLGRSLEKALASAALRC
jgi:hypothetical protein